MTKNEFIYLFSRRNLADLICEWYGNRAWFDLRYERKGLRHVVFFSRNGFRLDSYWGHGESLFRKVAEYRAVCDMIMEEAGRYHWEEAAK